MYPDCKTTLKMSTREGWYYPLDFLYKAPILMILVLEDRYESSLSIGTKMYL